MNSRIVSIACLLVLLAPQLQAASETEQRLERLERRVSHITALTLEVEGLKRDNRHLQGRVEELQHQLSNLQRKQRDMYADMDERLSQAGAAGGTVTPPAGMSDNEVPPVVPPVYTPPATEPPPVSNVAPGDPAKEEAAYAAAYDLLRPEQRRYQEAIAAFELFIQQYPNGKLVANAYYWLGEANYVTQNNEAALTAFRHLLKQYPQSPKAPGALLKIGYIQDAMGDKASARASLQRVMDDYPTSSAAGMAKTRLNNM